jgi:hypothetical protein
VRAVYPEAIFFLHLLSFFFSHSEPPSTPTKLTRPHEKLLAGNARDAFFVQEELALLAGAAGVFNLSPFAAFDALGVELAVSEMNLDPECSGLTLD